MKALAKAVMACTNRVTASLYRSHIRLRFFANIKNVTQIYFNRVVEMAESIIIAKDFEVLCYNNGVDTLFCKLGKGCFIMVNLYTKSYCGWISEKS